MAIPKLIHYSDNSYVTSEGTLFEGFETFSDWTKPYGDSIEADSINTREGVLSLKLNSVDGVAVSADKTISKDFSATTNFIVWIYIHNLSTLSACVIVFSSVTNWSKALTALLPDYCFKLGWNRIVITKGQFSATGGELWSNTMIRMKVRCVATGGNDTSVSFDDLRLDYEARPKVIITFDDGHESVYNKAKSIMDGNGQAGVAFLITDEIGTGGNMTLANLISLQNAGWDISNHSKTHSHLNALSQVAMENEIDDAYDWLIDNEFSVGAHFFAIPYGEYNQAMITKLKERHRIARCSIGGDFQPHFDLNDDDIEFLVKMRMVYNTDTTNTIQGWIDDAITQGAVLILLFHIIVDSGADTDTKYLTADFQTISNYLKTKSDADDLDVITFSDYYDQFMPSDLTSVVYLKHGPLVPFLIAHEPSESIGRSEDKRIKVYKHSLAGDRKRIWRIKCVIDNSGSSGYRWRDLEYFYWKVVEGAKHRCVFVDANSVQYLVRIISFGPPKAIGLNNRHEVTMILEEDYT